LTWLFISDLHLCGERPDLTRSFESFLTGPCRDARRLYILGDLFEYWAGDDDRSDPLAERVAAALATAVSAGLECFFMAGNRDFLLGADFATRAGLTLLDDPTPVDLSRRRALLLHGDTLCTDDAAYQAYRRQVREPAWQAAFLARPLAERLAIVDQIRQHSEAAKQEKAAAIMDVTPATVAATLGQWDCEVMIHGHTHRPGHHRLTVAGRERERWVLPDWRNDGLAPYLAWTGQGLENRTHPPT
jgi:UDP-2,3-diacylglucosamine hydrolase